MGLGLDKKKKSKNVKELLKTFLQERAKWNNCSADKTWMIYL